MFELILLVIMVVTMARIADADGQSAILWGSVALVVGIGCAMIVPFPYARVLMAGVATFVAMTLYKVVTNK